MTSLENLIRLIESTNDVRIIESNILSFGVPGEMLNGLMLILENRDNSTNTRAKALDVICRIDSAFGKEILLSYTQDADPVVRMEACGTLSYYAPEEKISNQLEKVLLSDSDVDVRLIACFSLKKTGTLSALKSLEWARENDVEENWETRRVSHYAEDAINAIKSRAGN